ncbi:hypothetical protein AVEN_224797-1 [Araneus ventricosus]|uniref:Uncharacterized protein n=1 Tax=Araneus ventricosus TaxID=182803 RepID=A0A4Y1ZM88_ARAVE|nr:hypothetical protein AVEN_224797-1 [Araneus ventricosus]
MIIPCTSLVTVNCVTPVLPRHIGRCNRSNTQAGVVVTINDHGRTSPEGGMYYHWREQEDKKSGVKYIMFALRESFDALLMAAMHGNNATGVIEKQIQNDRSEGTRGKKTSIPILLHSWL